MTVVAVTAARRTDGGRERVALNVAYVAALERAGLSPLILPTSLAPSRAAEALDSLRGLVLSGGEDVDPARYGAPPHPKLGARDGRRDEVEIALVHAARSRRLPVLAICRGVQLLNVALGGTLYQDLPDECPGPVGHAQDEHEVTIDPASLLGRTIGRARITANSRHHQALRDVAPPLAVVARAPDGIVEGVELRHPEGQWLLGVQWHPEDMVETELFRGFAEAVAGVEAGG